MTGYYQNLEADSFVASGDLSGLQHHFVEIVAAHKVGHALANQGYGVLLNKPQDGEEASVAIGGTVKCKAGGAVAVGDLIYSAASGWAQVHSPGAQVGSGDTLTERHIMGEALTAAGSGHIFALALDKKFTQVVSA